MSIRLSVIVPAFRSRDHLGRALASIRSTSDEVELIVVDGGSEDGTRELLEELSHEIAYWTSEPDRGQSHAINKGLRRCTGDLVTFIGADDLYLPGAFADAAERFRANPGCGAVVGGFVRIDGDGRVISPAVPARVPGPEPFDPMLADPGSWRLHQVATFFSRAALDDVGRWVDEDLHYTMDRELLNRVARKYPIVTSPKVYAAFRHHEGSKSTKDILPFSRELAALHFRDVAPGEPRPLARRRRMLARRHLAGGWLKLARAEAGPARRAVALLAALRYRPLLLVNRSYAARWLEALRLRVPPEFPARPLGEVIHEL